MVVGGRVVVGCGVVVGGTVDVVVVVVVDVVVLVVGALVEVEELDELVVPSCATATVSWPAPATNPPAARTPRTKSLRPSLVGD